MDSVVLANIFFGLAMGVYIKGVIALCDWLVEKKLLGLLISRKIVHISAACNILWWPLFDMSHWTWRLNSLVPTVYAVQLIYNGLFASNPDKELVKTISRTGRAVELCQGPLMFIVVLVYLGNYEFCTSTCVYTMAAMGFGDGLAPVVGSNFPFVRYRISGVQKTVSGSLTVMGGTMIGILWFRLWIGTPQSLAFHRIFGVSLIAMIAEAVSGKWDNIAMSLAIGTFLHMTDTRNIQ